MHSEGDSRVWVNGMNAGCFLDIQRMTCTKTFTGLGNSVVRSVRKKGARSRDFTGTDHAQNSRSVVAPM